MARDEAAGQDQQDGAGGEELEKRWSMNLAGGLDGRTGRMGGLCLPACPARPA